MGVFRRILGAVALLALAQASTLETHAAGASHPPPASLSFDTPEEGIAYFTAALNRGDTAAAMEAFALEEELDGLNFFGLGKRLRTVSLMSGASPERFAFYRDINRAKLTGEAALQLRNFVYSLLLPASMPLDAIIRIESSEDIDARLAEIEGTLDPARLQSLKLVGTGLPMPTTVASDVYRKLIRGQLDVSGADDLQEWVALYDLDGATFVAGFTFVRYGDDWQISSLTSLVAGFPRTGLAKPATEAEFLELLK